MIKIRLARKGKKHYPTYRIVVAESKFPRDGRHVDDIGYYQPMDNPMKISIDMDKFNQWITKGAKPTERVQQLIKYAQSPDKIKKLQKSRDVFKKGRIHKKKKANVTEETPTVEEPSSEKKEQ